MSYYVILILVLFAYMNVWFVISLIKKRNDVADVAWGLGFMLMAWTSFMLEGNSGIRGILVSILVSIWGLRLTLHIYNRNKGKAEDYRYQAWRKEWGDWFYIRSYFQVYLLQGFFLFLIVLPVLLVNNTKKYELGLLDGFGIAIWVIGFYFETLGDLQLAKFIKNSANKGKFIQSGLWAYSRHPNYFGEVTLWWGLWLITLSIPNAWFGIISPITITILIIKVSGIPMLEKKMAENPDFAEYKRRVSAFFPMKIKD